MAILRCIRSYLPPSYNDNFKWSDGKTRNHRITRECTLLVPHSPLESQMTLNTYFLAHDATDDPQTPAYMKICIGRRWRGWICVFVPQITTPLLTKFLLRLSEHGAVMIVAGSAMCCTMGIVSSYCHRRKRDTSRVIYICSTRKGGCAWVCLWRCVWWWICKFRCFCWSVPVMNAVSSRVLIGLRKSENFLIFEELLHLSFFWTVP